MFLLYHKNGYRYQCEMGGNCVITKFNRKCSACRYKKFMNLKINSQNVKVEPFYSKVPHEFKDEKLNMTPVVLVERLSVLSKATQEHAKRIESHDKNTFQAERNSKHLKLKEIVKREFAKKACKYFLRSKTAEIIQIYQKINEKRPGESLSNDQILQTKPSIKKTKARKLHIFAFEEYNYKIC